MTILNGISAIILFCLAGLASMIVLRGGSSDITLIVAILSFGFANLCAAAASTLSILKRG